MARSVMVKEVQVGERLVHRRVRAKRVATALLRALQKVAHLLSGEGVNCGPGAIGRIERSCMDSPLRYEVFDKARIYQGG